MSKILLKKSKTNKKLLSRHLSLIGLILGHFTVDWYSGILKPLLPQIMQIFSLTAGQTALIPSVLGILTAFFQPFSAAFGERFGEKFIVIFSIMLSAVFIPLIGISKSLIIFLLFLSIGMIGNSMFHPNAASLVGDLGFEKSHTVMSIFSIGGTIGSGLAPVVIIVFVNKFGFAKMPVLSVAGVVLSIAIAIMIFSGRDKQKQKKEIIFNFKSLFAKNGIFPLLLVNVLRSLSIIGFSTLIPLYLTAIGYSPIWGSYFLTSSRFSGAIGTYLGAALSDRIGPKAVNKISLLFGTLFGIAFFVFGNIYLMLTAFFFAFLFWFFTMGANVTYMQTLIPEKKGMASSLSMGISWGAASVILSVLSAFIDVIGLKMVFYIVFAASPVAFLLSFNLFEPKKQHYN